MALCRGLVLAVDGTMLFSPRACLRAATPPFLAEVPEPITLAIRKFPSMI
jgi:hypothetical protein